MSTVSDKQKSAAPGMIVGALGSAVFVGAAFYLWPLPALAAPALTVFGYSCALGGVALLAGIGVSAHRRFFAANGLHTSASEHNPKFDVTDNYIQSTLEQLLLFICAQAGLAAALGSEARHLAPILAGLFLVARLTFWFGDRINSIARGFGFAATFYPTAVTLIGLFAWIAYRALLRLAG